MEGYKWSGYAGIMSEREKKWQDKDEILRRFGDSVIKARESYIRFMEDGVKQGKRKDFAGGGLIRSMGGIESVMMNRRAGFREMGDDRILGPGEFVEGVLKNEEQKDKTIKEIKKLGENKLKDKIESYYKITEEELTGKSQKRKITQARGVLSYIAIKYAGKNGSQLAKILNVSSSGIARMYTRGEKIIESDNKILEYILDEGWSVNTISNVP